MLVLRTKSYSFECDVFKKNRNTIRELPIHSFYSEQYKLASINFLVDCLSTFPLTKERFDIKQRTIEKIAEYDGYSPIIVKKM